MAQTYSNLWKNCATCAYWTGARQCGNFNQSVVVGSSSDRGQCAIPKGGWKGQQRAASSTCNDWGKWPVLK